jgi:hypothetical protein
MYYAKYYSTILFSSLFFSSLVLFYMYKRKDMTYHNSLFS